MIGTQAPRLEGAQQPSPPARTWRRLERYRLLACCLLLIAVPFATAPGDIISDTKFELALNPSGFLSSALTLWDPQQFGGLLNQAVGYLFPMGPFFEVLKLMAVAGWVTQRLWLALVLIAAFTGTVKLAGRMGIGTPWTRLLAGLAYALSPAGLAIIGQMSGEYLPMALCPWILVPLADSRPWTNKAPGAKARAVARSAAAVALASGMNAASTAAVLVPAVLYILTRRNVSKVAMFAWWTPAVALVSLFWAVPLVLLSKFGISVVAYTESAQVTAASTSLLNIFRGTENWVNYLVVSGQEWRPLAFQLSTDVVPALLAGLLAALGLAGLVRRDLPERRFLLWSAVLGVVVIALGYASSLGSPLENHLVGLINGPASVFRNLWKFDPMLRLPLALGLGHLLARTVKPQHVRATLLTLTGVAFGGILVPAFATGLASGGAFAQVPPYWTQAADWLTAHAGNQAVLVEPGAPFGQYLWGSPMDDVLQSLTSVDYAERNLSTVGSAGNERLLNTIDEDLAAGDGSAGLTQVLARMGIKYVVVRDDLDRTVLAGAWPARISDALAGSPGITQVARFGPLIAGFGPDDAATNFDAPYPAVQVYQVPGAEPAAVVQPAADTLRVYGAPESLITLAGEGLLGTRPVLLDNDGAGQPVAGTVNTDSLRRRVVNFGQLRTNYSPTLAATQPAQTFLSTDDYTEQGWIPYEAVARYTGIKDVTASSSASDIQALSTQWASGMLPYSAVDGNLGTFWESGSWDGPVGQWLQVDFDRAVDPGTIDVRFADNAAIGPPVTRVTITTATGQVSDPVRATSGAQTLNVPDGESGWLRITITALAYPPTPELGPQAGIIEIDVPGVTASRTIVAPAVAGDPSATVLAKAQPLVSGCMLTSLRWVCSPLLSSANEEQFGFDHSFTEQSPQRAVVHGSAILINPSLADRYARFPLKEAAATASSTYTSDPQDQPRSAFDGNPATAWIASPLDPHPTLSIKWRAPRKIGQVTIERPPGADSPLQVLITGSAGQVRGASVGADGVVRFTPMKTTSLTFAFTTAQAPLQITDVVIPGVPFVSTPTGAFHLACGLGPRLSIDGKNVPTRVSGTFTDLLNGQPMEFTACSQVRLAAGTNQVTEPPTDGFDVQDVVLASPAAAAHAALATAAPAAPKVLTWTASKRTLRVSAPSRSYLVVNENFNTGWRAVTGGRTLTPVRLDGWKQAWVLPAGTAGVVTLTYAPEQVYRDAVIGGLAALAVVLLIATGLRLPRRRRSPAASGKRPASGEQPVAAQAGPVPWSDEPPRSRWPWPLRWLGLLAAFAVLAGAGLVLGGYPGAALVPGSALMFVMTIKGRMDTARPWVLAGLLAGASACGAVGEHLALSGDIGLEVSAPANAIPQVICLIVVGGLAAALIRATMERNRDQRQD